MNEHLMLLSHKYPAVAEVLQRQGNESLHDYLTNIGHQSLPDILPAQDLLNAVWNYLTPFFGAETAGKAVDIIARYRCLSTANHHHPAFYYGTVQDSILYDQWLRISGETEDVVPIFAISNVNLKNVVYPRGAIVYDCTLPEKRLRLPIFPTKLRPVCVAGLGGIRPSMCRAAMDRLAQEERNGTINASMFNAISKYYDDILLSESVQKYDTYREQTTVINALLSQRYFTDRKPMYMWIDLESIVSKLLQQDLQHEDTVLNCILFDKEVRNRLLIRLDGVSGCWTGAESGTHFFWGLDDHGVLFPMRLRMTGGETVLSGNDSAGCEFTIPFSSESICEQLKKRAILPSMFLIFLEIHFLRSFTVLGGYYQPTYLGQMRDGIVRTLREMKLFEEKAAVIEARENYMTLGLIYLVRDHGTGAFPVSTAELLEQPVSTLEIGEKLKISVTEAFEILSFSSKGV